MSQVSTSHTENHGVSSSELTRISQDLPVRADQLNRLGLTTQEYVEDAHLVFDLYDGQWRR